MSTRIHDFIQKYNDALKFFGRGLNGLERAELYSTLKESGTEEILEMLETIRQHEETMEAIKIPPFGASPQPTIGVSTGTSAKDILWGPNSIPASGAPTKWVPNPVTTGGCNQNVTVVIGNE